MFNATKCCGEFNGIKCLSEATHWVRFGHETFPTCDACYKKYDALARKNLRKGVEDVARKARFRVS
jgi:hypothetical protein